LPARFSCTIFAFKNHHERKLTCIFVLPSILTIGFFLVKVRVQRRRWASSETGMLQTPEGREKYDGFGNEADGITLAWYRPVKAVSGVMGTAKRQMARSETGMVQTCKGSKWGDGYSEEADGEA
jgi:hypothetical protein